MSREKQIEGMAEILRKVCEPSLLDECDSKNCNECMAEAIYNDAFTEDVAPRAEVAREIFEEIDKFLKEKHQAVDDIWCDIEDDDEVLDAFCMAKTESYFVVKNFVDKLKKKYTEPEPPKGG